MKKILLAVGLALMPLPAVAADASKTACTNPNHQAVLSQAAPVDAPSVDGITGTVEVAVSLDAAGNVTDARVQSSPSAILTKPALKAALASTYAPATLNCRATASNELVQVAFDTNSIAMEQRTVQAPATPKPVVVLAAVHVKPKAKVKWLGDDLSAIECPQHVGEFMWHDYCQNSALGKLAIHPGAWEQDGHVTYTVVSRRASAEQLAFVRKMRSYPCHATSTTFGSSHNEVWYYACHPDVLGSIAIFWHNGHQVGQEEL